jgi:hypothetical protein
MRAQVAAWCEALAAVGDGTADVARLHLADRQRLTGILVDEPMDGRSGGTRAEVGVPDYERWAADAVAAEFGDRFDGVGAGLDGVGPQTAGAGARLDGSGEPEPDPERTAGRRTAALDMGRQGVTERAPEPDTIPDEAVDPVVAADRATANVREALPARRPPRRNIGLGTREADRMLDLRAEGRPVREIAKEVGVSESTVRKRLREYEATGPIPIVKVR